MKIGQEHTLDFGTFTVTVRRRADDWWACLNGKPGVWNCGKTLDYAVGYMVLTHYDRLVGGTVNTEVNNPE